MYSTSIHPLSKEPAMPRKSFVQHIEIEGRASRDMYDEHPGFAYFQVDESRSVFVPPFCSLERAIDIAIRAYAVLESKAIEYEDECEGDFVPHRVVMFDGARRVVFQFDGSRESADQQLAAPLPPLHEHDALLKQAHELSSEAAFESGWDNFSTAERLRKQSEDIKATVSRSRHFASVVKTETIRGLEVRAVYALTHVLMRVDRNSYLAQRKKVRAIKRNARRLGYFEALHGITTAPVMFDDCSDLKEAWLEGAREWEEIAKCRKGLSVDSFLLH